MSNKFKVGDRVRFNWRQVDTDSPGGKFAQMNGKSGVVTQARSSVSNYPYSVQFDHSDHMTAVAEAELTLEVPAYTVEHEGNPVMTKFKVGDRVTFSGELEVVRDSAERHGTVSVRAPGSSHGTVSVRVPGSSIEFAVWRSDVTKVKPVLPTAFGSVVEVGGLRYLLDGSGYWSTARDSRTTPKAMAEVDYTVVREGI